MNYNISINAKKLRSWIPVPSPVPLRTFPQRLIRKSLFITKRAYFSIFLRMGFIGARVVGVAPNGNTLLRLNRNYALGSKGVVLELPEDRVIFESVRRQGVWELEESQFLAYGLKRACQKTDKVALLDIGANTGLVTLQAINLSNTTPEVFLFEPISRHTSAIKHNLRSLRNIHINEFGLSDSNGFVTLFTEATNYGNTSLLESVVPEIDVISTQSQFVDTAEYCNKFFKAFGRFVIKCDAQGMDALILSRIPEWIWRNCESAVVEVWALEEIKKQDVEALLSMFQDFNYIAWQSNSRTEEIELAELRTFWLSKSKSSRNLFLSKVR